MKTLSKTQQELADAMKAGVIVHYGWSRAGGYYFRADNLKNCTAAALALLSKGHAVSVGMYTDRTIALKDPEKS